MSPSRAGANALRRPNEGRNEPAMIHTLVPVDGSENALRVLRHVVKLAAEGAVGPDDIHLINVQPGLGGGVTRYVGREAVEGFHREEADKAMASARAILDVAKLPFRAHIAVGLPGEVIVAFARDRKFDRAVMGTRGLGRLAELVLGSVASDAIRDIPVPVTLIR
jgi:nucleotide-binding universal stress UspA family protein